MTRARKSSGRVREVAYPNQKWDIMFLNRGPGTPYSFRCGTGEGFVVGLKMNWTFTLLLVARVPTDSALLLVACARCARDPCARDLRIRTRHELQKRIVKSSKKITNPRRSVSRPTLTLSLSLQAKSTRNAMQALYMHTCCCERMETRSKLVH